MTDPFDRDVDFDLDLDLVGRYVSGAASPGERRAFERWVAAGAGRQELVAQLEQVWRQAGTLEARNTDDVDVDAKWHALRQAIRPTRVVPFPAVRGRNRRLRWAYAAAAAIALALGAGALWHAGAGRPGSSTTAAADMREYVTSRGQRMAFHLPDGTAVTLGVASRLRVPVDYGRRDRTVYLTGEAYFSVTHDSAARFFVHAGDAVTEDLGTRFGIRAYPADSTVQVAVAEGRVALRIARNEAVLGAGQLRRTTVTGEIVAPPDADVARALAWTQGRLEFRGTPLREALPQLGRWFDLEFRLGDSVLAERRLTASFQDRLDDRTLAGVALVLGARIRRDGPVVTFYRANGAGK